MIPELAAYFPESDYNVIEETDRCEVHKLLRSTSASTWGQGPIKETGYFKLASPSATTAGAKRLVIVCREELTRLREYRSATDYPILAAAVRDMPAGDGLLSTAKAALIRAGIEWPKCFNSDAGLPATEIDRDLCRATQNPA